MYKISLRLCFSTIAADVVICADCHDKKKWILGRLFDACVLLRIFLGCRMVMSLRNKYSFNVLHLLDASLKLVQTLQRKTW